MVLDPFCFCKSVLPFVLLPLTLAVAVSMLTQLEVRMKLSMSSEMGIHAVWFLAKQPPNSPIQSSFLASGIGASETYLTKVLHRLADAKVLRSKKGKTGGFYLARSPESITLADVVRACEADEPLYSCQREVRGCPEELTRCPICKAVDSAKSLLFDELSKTSIADLLAFGWRGPESANPGVGCADQPGGKE